MKKAGNLLHLFNNSSGDFVAIFDADFAPRSDFFRQLVPYFDDRDVGIVQSPQYFAPDCHANWLQQGAGAVQEFFYRGAQTGRTTRGGAICVGTNAVYRRAALESNGGPAQVPLSEDVHTGFELMGHGWRLDYVPIVLAAGLCPDNKRAYFNQQYRWCTGSINLIRSRKFWSQAMPLAAAHLLHLRKHLLPHEFAVSDLRAAVRVPARVRLPRDRADHELPRAAAADLAAVRRAAALEQLSDRPQRALDSAAQQLDALLRDPRHRPPT